jgi:hypothetical protein
LANCLRFACVLINRYCPVCGSCSCSDRPSRPPEYAPSRSRARAALSPRLPVRALRLHARATRPADRPGRRRLGSRPSLMPVTAATAAMAAPCGCVERRGFGSVWEVPRDAVRYPDTSSGAADVLETFSPSTRCVNQFQPQ